MMCSTTGNETKRLKDLVIMMFDVCMYAENLFGFGFITEQRDTGQRKNISTHLERSSTYSTTSRGKICIPDLVDLVSNIN